MQNRIGLGYDVHRLEAGHSLIIGGVNFDFHKGTVAHSDGDVLVHAICDALLGAAGLRDIGFHFPDTDNSLKGINSLVLLGKTLEHIKEKGYKVVNLDSTICLQMPKIQDYIPQMKEILSGIIGIDQSDISIKATTTEKLGFVGAGNGISCYSVVLLEK